MAVAYEPMPTLGTILASCDAENERLHQIIDRIRKRVDDGGLKDMRRDILAIAAEADLMAAPIPDVPAKRR